MKNLVVFDIDGVLFNCAHRTPAYESGDMQTYFSGARKDEPIYPGIVVCNMFLQHPSFRVVFVTGRGDTLEHRRDTLYMLNHHLFAQVINDQLLMRKYPIPTREAHPDTVVKPQMLVDAGYNLRDIFLVFEDRPSIVDMWRQQGITCYQTEKGWD